MSSFSIFVTITLSSTVIWFVWILNSRGICSDFIFSIFAYLYKSAIYSTSQKISNLCYLWIQLSLPPNRNRKVSIPKDSCVLLCLPRFSAVPWTLKFSPANPYPSMRNRGQLPIPHYSLCTSNQPEVQRRLGCCPASALFQVFSQCIPRYWEPLLGLRHVTCHVLHHWLFSECFLSFSPYVEI